MPQTIWSDDGQVLLAHQDDVNEQGVKQSVVYYRGEAVWDRWSYEASNGLTSSPPVNPPSGSTPIPSDPLPAQTSKIIRVTNDSDGIIAKRMYSYWPNAWVGPGGVIWVFCGNVDGTPRLFKVAGENEIERHIITDYFGETEGWYWDLRGWITLISGPQLRRLNPFTGEDELLFDISQLHPGCTLWQAHSSADGRVHSATVQRPRGDEAAERIGTVVSISGNLTYIPAQGALDESAIDASGRFLLIKETFVRDKERLDNRLIDLQTHRDIWIHDEDGAIGHSDMGAGFVVGENDIIGACVYMDLETRRQRPLFNTWNMGYVSVRGRKVLNSGDSSYLSYMDLDVPSVVNIPHGNNDGGQSNPNYYDDRVKANISPCGRVACYMSNLHGRFDVYLAIL